MIGYYVVRMNTFGQRLPASFLACLLCLKGGNSWKRCNGLQRGYCGGSAKVGGSFAGNALSHGCSVYGLSFSLSLRRMSAKPLAGASDVPIAVQLPKGIDHLVQSPFLFRVVSPRCRLEKK